MVHGDKSRNRGRFSTSDHSVRRPADTASDGIPEPQATYSLTRPKSRSPFRLVGFVVLGFLFAGVVAVPAVWLGWPLVAGTAAAGKGADCPGCAVDVYLSEGPLALLGGDELLFERHLCQRNRAALSVQARRFADTYLDAGRKWNLSPELTAGAIEGDGPANFTDGKATLAVPVTHSHQTQGGNVVSRKTATWLFEVVDEDGWRVCAVTHPDVCRELVDCAGPPSPNPSTEPLRKVWDTRVPYKCLPDKPYRELEKGCGPPPDGWVQPGPYYCAPDQPFGIPANRKDKCAVLGW